MKQNQFGLKILPLNIEDIFFPGDRYYMIEDKEIIKLHRIVTEDFDEQKIKEQPKNITSQLFF